MKRVLILLVAMVVVMSVLPGMVPAAGVEKECSWGAVTAYTDGTPVEAGKTVYYNAMMDNVLKATRTMNTWFKFQVTDHGVAHTFVAQAELSTGEKSAWSPPFSWTSPAGTPATPAPGCTITDPIH